MNERPSEVGVTFISNSPEDTVRLAKACGEVLGPGMLISLRGSMGKGKTTFVSGLARGLGLPDVTHSPTFTIVAEHLEGRLPLYHADLYRLGESAQAEISLLDEYIFGDGVCVIEWPELVEGLLPKERLDVHFVDTEANEDEADRRLIVVAADGDREHLALEKWVEKWQS